MSDIDKSFTFLQESIPQWLQDIAGVEERVAAMQDRVTKIAVSQSTFAKRKSESIESIQPTRLDAIAEDPSPWNGAHTDPLGNRKRKTLSVLSGRASGPLRHRPKQMVIVSYDGDMQKSFEALVRAIGTGRNLLRKAKMEARMNDLAALAGGSSDEEEEESIVSKISYRPRMPLMRGRAAARGGGQFGVSCGSYTPVELFDTTDKTLENAQGLCEKAAHFTLRDGDCRKELDGIRQNFKDVLEIAKAEVVKCNAKKSPEPLEAQLQENSGPSICSVEPSYKEHFTSLSPPPPKPQAQPKVMLPDVPTAAAPSALKVIDIEVDDEEEDEDVEFFMPPIRLTSQLTSRA